MRPRRSAQETRSRLGVDVHATLDLEPVLRAWGRFLREEVEDEVGLPKFCPSCAGYEAPKWSSEGGAVVTQTDLERACWTATVLASRRPRTYRDLREHYRDQMRISGARLEECRVLFAATWREWDFTQEPTNPQ